MKKGLYPALHVGRLFLIVSGILFLFQNCGNNEDQIQADNHHYIINLFPDTGANNRTDQLSFEEAFTQSALVLRVPSIKKIDSSLQDGAPVFYLYQAPAGSVQKAPPNYHDDTHDAVISFLSEEALFKGASVNDSVYLFLEPLSGYHLLRSNISLQYHWVKNAPFLKD